MATITEATMLPTRVNLLFYGLHLYVTVVIWRSFTTNYHSNKLDPYGDHIVMYFCATIRGAATIGDSNCHIT
jgi:hypothetical protein